MKISFTKYAIQDELDEKSKSWKEYDLSLRKKMNPGDGLFIIGECYA